MTKVFIAVPRVVENGFQASNPVVLRAQIASSAPPSRLASALAGLAERGFFVSPLHHL